MAKTVPDGRTPLICAIQAGRIEAVKMLLEKGAPVNAKTADGATAITEAAGTGNTELARLLLAHGADPAGLPPGPLASIDGTPVQLRAARTALASVLMQITRTAARDGYTVRVDPGMDRKVSVRTKGPWNKVLLELAAQQQFLPLVKNREVFVLPYGQAAGKRMGR